MNESRVPVLLTSSPSAPLDSCPNAAWEEAAPRRPRSFRRKSNIVEHRPSTSNPPAKPRMLAPKIPAAGKSPESPERDALLDSYRMARARSWRKPETPTKPKTQRKSSLHRFKKYRGLVPVLAIRLPLVEFRVVRLRLVGVRVLSLTEEVRIRVLTRNRP